MLPKNWPSVFCRLYPRQCHGLFKALPAVLQAQTEGVWGEGGVSEVLDVGFIEPVDDFEKISRLLLQHNDHVCTEQKEQIACLC